MMSRKGLLTAVLSLALILPLSLHAQTASEKAPAVAPAQAAAPVTVSPQPPGNQPTSGTTRQPTATDAAGNPTNDGAPVSAMRRIEQKVDIKNLPKNLTSVIPMDGDSFIFSVGETKVITAARPRKCVIKDAPTFEEIKARLPQSDLFTYSDGGDGFVRFSFRCGGLVPARAVFVTGVKQGTAKLLILGNRVTVIVK